MSTAENLKYLAAALEDYQAALTRQTGLLRSELPPLQSSWRALSEVYEGEAAEQFRAGWLRTERLFEDYLGAIERLRPLLGQRLDALREANRTHPDLP